MKKIFLFATKPLVFLTELPPVILLIPSVIFNNSVNTLMKLYPLITVLSALIIFFAIYFFRAVRISYDEIKCIGLFSSREKAFIKQDRTLVITVTSKTRLRLELFGKNDDGTGSYAWLRNEEPTDINLFRAKANGGMRTIKRILRYFEAEENEIEKILNFDNSTAEYEKLLITSAIDNEKKTVKIYFKETI